MEAERPTWSSAPPSVRPQNWWAHAYAASTCSRLSLPERVDLMQIPYSNPDSSFGTLQGESIPPVPAGTTAFGAA